MALPDVRSLIDHAPQVGSNINGVKTFAAGGGAGTSPLVVAQNIQDLADQALAATATLPTTISDPELTETIGDIESMALAGRYYANKIRAAVSKAQGKTAAAIQSLQAASLAWRAYAARVHGLYRPEVMTRLYHAYAGAPAAPSAH